MNRANYKQKQAKTRGLFLEKTPPPLTPAKTLISLRHISRLATCPSRYFIIIFIIPFLFGFTALTSKTNQGNRHFKEGKTDEALNAYRDAQIDDPQNPIIFYNIGNTLSAQGKFEEAEAEFLKALDTDDKMLEAKTFYNLGNTYFRMGKLEQSVQMYEKSLSINHDDVDAKYNLELVRKKIKEMMENQENRQDEQQKSDDSQEEKSDSEEKQEGSSSDQQKQPEDQEKEEAADPHENEEKDEDKKEEQQAADSEKEEHPEEEQPEQKAGQQPEPSDEEMSEEDALRLLNALKQDEKDLMQNHQSGQARDVSPEKDW